MQNLSDLLQNMLQKSQRETFDKEALQHQLQEEHAVAQGLKLEITAGSASLQNMHSECTAARRKLAEEEIAASSAVQLRSQLHDAETEVRKKHSETINTQKELEHIRGSATHLHTQLASEEMQAQQLRMQLAQRDVSRDVAMSSKSPLQCIECPKKALRIQVLEDKAEEMRKVAASREQDLASSQAAVSQHQAITTQLQVTARAAADRLIAAEADCDQRVRSAEARTSEITAAGDAIKQRFERKASTDTATIQGHVATISGLQKMSRTSRRSSFKMRAPLSETHVSSRGYVSRSRC